MSIGRFLFLVVVFGLAIAAPPRALAIDLQPGEARPLPAGSRFAQTGIVVSKLDGFISDGHELEGSREIEAALSYVRLGYFFELSGLPAVAYVQTGVASNDLGGVLAPLEGNAGLDDTAFLLAVWPYANDSTKTYWAVGAYAFLPTGRYDNELGPLSVGKNRTAMALQSAMQTALSDDVGVMAAFDVVNFGTNDDFTSRNLDLDQKPLATAQVAVTYQLTPVYTLSAAYFYTFGGEYIVDGVDQDNANATHRYQLTGSAQLELGRLTVQYGGDLERHNGFFEQARGIVRFGRSF